MSYDVHVTRRNNWIDKDGKPITEQEWIKYIKSDPEMELRTEKRSDGVHGKAVGIWLRGNEGEGMPVYWDKRGEVILYEPRDDVQIKKMFAIAEALNAKLQGDDGEVYNADGTDSETARREALRRKGKQYRRGKIISRRLAYILLFIGIIGALGTALSHIHFSAIRITIYSGCIIAGVLLLRLSVWYEFKRKHNY